MPAPLSQDLKRQFAKWVAEGGKVADWCRERGVATGTAYDWYRADWFRRLVEGHRRPALERAIGQMKDSLETAIGELGRLVREGADDGVKLGAATALIDRMIDVQSHAELRARIRWLEARLSAQERRLPDGVPHKPKCPESPTLSRSRSRGPAGSPPAG